MIINNTTVNYHQNNRYPRITDAPYLSLYLHGRRLNRVLTLDELREYFTIHQTDYVYDVYPRKSKRTRAVCECQYTFLGDVLVRDKYTKELYLRFVGPTLKRVVRYNIHKRFDMRSLRDDAILCRNAARTNS